MQEYSNVDLIPGGVLFAIDDKFHNRYKELQELHPDVLKFEPNEIFQGGYHGDYMEIGKFLLLCSGMNAKIFVEDAFCDFSSLFGEIKFYPFKELIHLVENENVEKNCDYVRVPEGLLALILRGEENHETLSVCSGNRGYDSDDEYDSDSDEPDSFFVAEVKSSLDSLTKKHLEEGRQNNYSYLLSSRLGHQDWIRHILEKYLEQYGIYSYYTYFEVVSTRHGDVLQLGGMVNDVPYFAYSGMRPYNEDGWDDPRNDEADIKKMELLEVIFFGAERDSTLGFKKYTPQFGG